MKKLHYLAQKKKKDQSKESGQWRGSIRRDERREAKDGTCVVHACKWVTMFVGPKIHTLARSEENAHQIRRGIENHCRFYRVTVEPTHSESELTCSTPAVQRNKRQCSNPSTNVLSVTWLGFRDLCRFFRSSDKLLQSC